MPISAGLFRLLLDRRLRFTPRVRIDIRCPEARMTRSRPPAPIESFNPGKLSLVKAYCADAEKLLLEDRFHEARKGVREALRLAPNRGAAVHMLGVIEIEGGNLEGVGGIIIAPTELDPAARDPF